MLRVENLRKRYGKKDVLKGINLHLERGFWALIGKNGAGKTTLLKCIMAMVPFEGKIEISGKGIKGMDRREIAKKIGYVPQMTNQDVPLTVREFLEIGAYYRGGRIEEVLKILDYEPGMVVNTLSGGEFQKLLIARAMIGDPEILLLDEPASHLDIKNTAEIIRILREYAKRALVIAVIHDLNLLNFVDGAIAIKNGRAKILQKIDSETLRNIFDATVDVIENGKYHFVVPRYNGRNQ